MYCSQCNRVSIARTYKPHLDLYAGKYIGIILSACNKTDYNCRIVLDLYNKILSVKLAFVN